MASGPFPPQPSIEHLVTIFRRIDGKNLLIPAFQRTFVWKQAQVLALLDSVYSGFPIGSILLWRVDRPVLKISDAEEIPFPRGDASFPANFVLDGLQRLSTLYGVFHYGAHSSNEIFNVGFQITDERFMFATDSDCDENTFVPLSALFNPRSLLSVQQRLLNSPRGDEAVQKMLTLQSRFQEYMIPLVTLAQRDPAEVVSIFERVNSTGTPLSRVDFMRAITWSEDFDLSQALEEIGDGLQELDFDLSDDTLVKALGLVFGLDPLPDVMLRLRERSAPELRKGVETTKQAFRRAVEFLREYVHVLSSDFLPYEGQVLVLFNIFCRHEVITGRQKELLKAWYYFISFTEALQGRPDNYIARLIHNVDSSLQANSVEVGVPHFDVFSWFDRRMIRRGALSTAFVTLFAQAGARSLITGKIIPVEEYLSAYDTANFLPIFTKDELPALHGNKPASAKIFPNVVLVPTSETAVMRARGGVKPVISRLLADNDKRARAILQSQMIPGGKTGVPDTTDFLLGRIRTIEAAIRALIGPAILSRIKPA